MANPYGMRSPSGLRIGTFAGDSTRQSSEKGAPQVSRNWLPGASIIAAGLPVLSRSNVVTCIGGVGCAARKLTGSSRISGAALKTTSDVQKLWCAILGLNQ